MSSVVPLSLERLVVPGTTATRWLLVADLVCLVALGLASRAPRLAIPAVLFAGFLGLNTLGMLLNDFFLGLAVFHLAIGLATLVLLRGARWLGTAALAVAVGLGIFT